MYAHVRRIRHTHTYGSLDILLTTDPFTQPLPSDSLIKLTDFGLSRFIDPAQPLLTTLCGSDSYAAPELVMGKPYDGRETDAWACGVVLYTLATRRLPFDTAAPNGVSHDRPAPAEADWEVQRRKRAERKGLLNRIAQGAYSWPEVPSNATTKSESEEEEPTRGIALAQSAGVRRMVAQLLVRDPRKRARVADLWIDAWMHDEAAPPPPVLEVPSVVMDGLDGAEVEVDEPDEGDADADADADAEGVLVDGEDIGPGSVARQEH